MSYISKLSVDILLIIFKDVGQENDETLYSCIFVNREWCQVTIPFLWNDPWKKFASTNQRAKRYKILFKCFLMMMPKESKEHLKINGINLLIEDTSSQNNSPSLQTPLFNYVSFCKVIDSFKIIDMIKYAFGYSLNQNLADLVEQEISKLLIGNTSKLKILTLHNKSPPITSFPNSSLSLSQLSELRCDTSMDSTIFYGLSQLCRNIEKLVIRGYDDDNHELILFIKQQVNLKRVKMLDNYDVIYFVQGQCKNLGEVLATKTSSIIELDIKDITVIPPILLKKFQENLTIFKFGIYYHHAEERLRIELENVLKDISLPNLQQLIVYEDCDLDIIAKIVEKTNGKLKKISIRVFYDPGDVNMLISTITKHCPKLELLDMLVNDNLNEVLELIKECKNLRGLALNPVYGSEQNIGEFFKILYNNASNQLRKFQFDSWELSKGVLNEFFENWNQQQRDSLDFYVSSYAFKDEYEYIIKNYQKLGVIRKFEKFIDFYNFLDSWW